MTSITVDPTSVLKYGELAVEQFTKLNARLDNIIQSVSTVDFHGDNAYELKTKSAAMAVEYARAMHDDLKQISDAVRMASSQIARSMGGATINLPAPPAASVKTPVIKKPTGVQSMNPDALRNLVPEIKRWFDAIQNLLDAHLTHLVRTRWEGEAKEQAVNAVRKFTAAAKSATDDAENAMTKYIETQVQMATQADRSLS